MGKNVTDIFQNDLDSMLGGGLDTPDEVDDWYDFYDEEDADTIGMKSRNEEEVF